jgi:transaldolase
MKIFVDSCDPSEIAMLKERGLADGVTTNPSLLAQHKKDAYSVIKDICQIIDTSVSVQMISAECDDILREAEKFLAIGEQITIKLPFTLPALHACKLLSQQQRLVNMTLCFTPLQALAAAKAGAAFVSPFIGRLEDNGSSGMELLRDIICIYSNYPRLGTEVMAASIRNQNHITQAALLGTDIITAPAKLLKELVNSHLTTAGLEKFLQDHRSNTIS